MTSSSRRRLHRHHLYRHRTLAELAGAIEESRSAAATSGDQPDELGGPFLLTPTQRGFLLAEALSPDARSDWLACFRLAGPVDTVLFQRAIDLLVERHLMLRVAIAADQRPPMQYELPTASTVTVL